MIQSKIWFNTVEGRQTIRIASLYSAFLASSVHQTNDSTQKMIHTKDAAMKDSNDMKPKADDSIYGGSLRSFSTHVYGISTTTTNCQRPDETDYYDSVIRLRYDYFLNSSR